MASLTVVEASVLAALAVAVLVPGRPTARLARPSGASRPASRPREGGRWAGRARRPAVVVVALVVASAVGGLTGPVVGLGVGVALDRWTARAPSRDEHRRRTRRADALPSVVGLFAACLRAGAVPTAAVSAIVPGLQLDPTTGLAADLARVLGRLERGATPDEAWQDVPDDLLPLARVVTRAAVSGAPAADQLAALAHDLRAERQSQRLEATHRLGTRTAAPLGLCFLPGFVVLGVVPLVVGLADGLW